jgi:pullulanase-type alpha-1,6-glucosidase
MANDDYDTYRIYYQAQLESDYAMASLYLWNDNACGALKMPSAEANDWAVGLKPTGVDPKGVYWEVQANDHPTQCINFIPRINGVKPLGEFDAKLDLTATGAQQSVYTQQGVAAVYPELIPLSEVMGERARVYFNAPDIDPSSLTLHLWNDEQCDQYAGENTTWPGNPVSGVSDTYGAYWDVPVVGGEGCFHFIPNNKSVGDFQTADLQFKSSKVSQAGNIVMVFKGTDKTYYQPLTEAPVSKAELTGASAIFVDDKVIAVPAMDATSLSLYFSSTGGMTFDEQKQAVRNSETSIDAVGTSRTVWQISAPHLKSKFVGFDLGIDKPTLKKLAKGQLFAVAEDTNGVLLVTEVQSAKLLDALYAREAAKLDYGAQITQQGTGFRLWAPTAQQVVLKHYSDDKQEQASIPMTLDEKSGAWHVDTGLSHGDYYRYEITLYHPSSKEIETYEVTDPYSLSLSTNSAFSQVVDLTHASLKPDGWDALQAPHSQANAADFVLYEAHIRDFSALDASTASEHRGKYLAFAQPNTAPVKHLKSLSEVGVSHLHLLPAFDIATINEDALQIIDVDDQFSHLCTQNPEILTDRELSPFCKSDSSIADVLQQLQASDSINNPIVQRLHNWIRNSDSFNWGYDPYHYTVPEGSYSSNAEGMQRIIEFREMVMAIKNDIGMNVVMDVVYNHTNAQGLESKSVLDKVVPWYYHRLNEFSGAVEKSTCCANTAPEHRMFAKLIDDSIQTWVGDYKIDAFRWDLMGHHPLSQMKRTLTAAQQINPEVYFYGEGWNFGEVENDQRFKQATQSNLAGTGIGSFSDRLRDAVRGGGPFDESQTIRRRQGFGNGAYVLPNELNQQDDATKQEALHLADLVRLGMAGNLAQFSFIDSNDALVLGKDVDYNGVPAGYAKDAWEIQNYVSKHDNQSLWDNHQYKIPFTVDAETRVRMQAVSLATVMLGQGVPFVHMGSELLRSKSMERDSYDSGDWYNRVDFTMQSNNWNKGLPREDKDGKNWSLITEVIEQSGAHAVPTANQIANMDDYFKELSALRQSSALYRLGKGEVINQRVSFHNTGSQQKPGLIVMKIDNDDSLHDALLDSERKGIVVVINASPKAVKGFARLDMAEYQLSTLQTHDRSLATNEGTRAKVVDGELSVGPWTVSVFERF